MLTATQITDGTARLTANKLKDDDVVKMIAVFRMFLGSLEEKYSYDFEGKLRALDDADPTTGHKAAQVAACIIAMEELEFGVAELQSGNGVNYKEKSDYEQYVIIAFAQLYPLPDELSRWDLRRRSRDTRTSSSIRTSRVEN